MARDSIKKCTTDSKTSTLKNHLGPIALLGTSADPPTCGHQALLEGLLTLFPRVITWASDNPMKSHGASLKTRHALLNALVNEIDNRNLELDQELSSPWTIATLQKAAIRWPNTELIFVIGSDLIEQIPHWLNAKECLQKVRIGVAPREGWPLDTSQLQTLKSLGGQIELLPLKIPSTASSDIRNNPKSDQIPTAVLSLLVKLKLYGLNT